MFSFLKAKTPEQAAVRELKRLQKQVVKAGGATVVCYKFWKFLEGNTFYNTTGLVAEEDAPYPRMVVILAALELLSAWKETTDGDPAAKELMVLLSQRAYVAALLTLNHSEITELHQSIGGSPGGTAAGSQEARDLEVALVAEIAARNKKAEEAWERWKASDFDLTAAIQIASA